MDITEKEYNDARLIVFEYEKRQALKIKSDFIEKYKGKTKDDIVVKEFTVGRFNDKAYSLFVVDMEDDLVTIREHESKTDKWWTLERGHRVYKTFDDAFNACCVKLKRKGYIH